MMDNKTISSFFKYLRYFINLGSKLFVVFISAAVVVIFSDIQSDLVKAIITVCAIAYCFRIIPIEQIERILVYQNEESAIQDNNQKQKIN